ncbi:lysozyme inhibitor LprI family protein [Novosphingobium naphthalenivorans]|uniref:lysozyme inhibitor LprI family protein n=1 Tax=Novosphingobium naphthalenivorans TaxID=273168 RepID=UPI003571029E
MQTAPDQIENPYPANPVCDAVDTVGMIECNKHDLAVWEARLNDEYRKALVRVGPVSREKLRQAQRMWLKYRTANCEVYESHGGTIHFLLGSGCIIRMTKERTLELQGFDTGFE